MALSDCVWRGILHAGRKGAHYVATYFLQVGALGFGAVGAGNAQRTQKYGDGFVCVMFNAPKRHAWLFG